MFFLGDVLEFFAIFCVFDGQFCIYGVKISENAVLIF